MFVNKKGFTLVELLIGAMIGAIILLSVYVVFNVATKYWSKGNSATSATQTARYALDHLSRNLKMAKADGGNTYNITTDDTYHYQSLKYSDSSGTPHYYFYFFSGYTENVNKRNKIYWGTSSDHTSGSNMPLTGTEEVAAGNKIQILPVGDNLSNGIFSKDGSNWQYTGTDVSIVYIDFIAQDSSVQSNQQTAGSAPKIEIRTAVTYPHF